MKAGGFEQENNSSLHKKCAKCVHQNPKPVSTKPQKGPVGDESKLPPDVAEIVYLWPKLPEHIKAAIKALVETSKTTNRTQ